MDDVVERLADIKDDHERRDALDAKTGESVRLKPGQLRFSRGWRRRYRLTQI